MCIQNTGKQKIKKLKGFTLIELIVTVLITGVIFAAGVPGLQSLLGNVSLNAGADKLASSLAYARGEAVARVENIAVTTTASGWIVYIDTNANCARDAAVAAVAASPGPPAVAAILAIAGEEILRVVDVSADSVTVTAKCVIFNGLGENGGGAVETFTVDSIAASAGAATVRVSVTGYTSID
ncbi:MAG: prepilin-type N-terminal cleavage/methylation domain-containing protein [Cellvibrionaceae bacterium]|jgi:prepilin-type N-terminal cleavage/methylation domain-containing protein